MESKVHENPQGASGQKAEPEKNKINAKFKCNLQVYRMNESTLITQTQRQCVSFYKMTKCLCGKSRTLSHPTGPLSFQTKL